MSAIDRHGVAAADVGKSRATTAETRWSSEAGIEETWYRIEWRGTGPGADASKYWI